MQLQSPWGKPFTACLFLFMLPNLCHRGESLRARGALGTRTGPELDQRLDGASPLSCEQLVTCFRRRRKCKYTGRVPFNDSANGYLCHYYQGRNRR